MDAAISRFLVPTLRPGGSHSSRPAIADGLQQPTRKSSGSGQAILPYLVLLRVGFSLPLRLPATRCALTAPFHPYLRIRRSAGGIFSVALIRRTGFEPAPPAVNRHAALWRPDFASHAPNAPFRKRSSARATACRRPSHLPFSHGNQIETLPLGVHARRQCAIQSAAAHQRGHHQGPILWIPSSGACLLENVTGVILH